MAETSARKTVVLLNAKSKLQKEREAKEAKARAEQEATAAVYQSFVASFNDEEDPTTRKDGSVQPMKHKLFVPSGASDGRGGVSPTNVPATSHATNRPPTATAQPSRMPTTFRDEEDRSTTASAEARGASQNQPPANSVAQKKPVREMDKFLEEIKQKQEKAAAEGPRRPLIDDANTSNIFVANLSPRINEDYLRRLFGKYGPIQSIKIIWPRSADSTRRTNSGFVNFVHRVDAEAAMHEISDKVVEGNSLFLDWAKPLQSQATTSPAPTVVTSSTAPSAIHSTVTPAHTPGAAASNDAPVNASVPSVSRVIVTIPASKKVRKTIDLVAAAIARDGIAFETALLAHWKKNSTSMPPEFAWLFEPSSAEYAYYRWRTYAFLQGDSENSWREEVFVIQEGGVEWKPPANDAAVMPASMDDNADDTRSWRGKNKLKTHELIEWQELMRGITLERSSIGKCMAFALDHAACAKEIIELLTASFDEPACPAPILVARLYLMSDILHNSSAPIKNASLYRSELQASLPRVFEALSACYRTIAGRFTSEAMRDRVMRVLSFWERISVFPPMFLSGLEATFFRKLSDDADQSAVDALDDATLPHEEIRRKCTFSGLSVEGSTKDMLKRLGWLTAYIQAKVVPTPAAATTTVAPVAASTTAASDQTKSQSMAVGAVKSDGDVAGSKQTNAQAGASKAPAEDVDGVALQEDVNGVALEEDVDGVALEEDVDGVALEEDVDGVALQEDVDGVALQEDVDGMPLSDDVDGAPLMK